jgi:Xaa-Pro aminopeptidase
MMARGAHLIVLSLLLACGAPSSGARATATAAQGTATAGERAAGDLLSAVREAAQALPTTGAPRDGIEHQELFAERRAEFLRRMGSGVAVLHAKPVYERNEDVEFPYRQDSDFYYLTGFEEPEAVAVLSAPGEGHPSYVLFVRPRNPAEEIWTGHRWGREGATRIFKADAAYVLDSLPAVMPRLLEGASQVLYGSGGDVEFGSRLTAWVARSGSRSSDTGRPRPERGAGQSAEEPGAGNTPLPSPLPILHEMRLIHTPAEIARIQRAIDITELALRATMRAAAPGLHEYDLEALQYYLYRTRGSQRYGFPSIVASGPNSVTLHYAENNRQLEEGELIVLDIGAEYAMYSADVSRTIPVSGRFSPEQREIYQIVADAQDAAMELMRPGRTIGEAHQKAVEVVTRGLLRLGLLKGTLEENIQSGAYSRFFMHSTSHWIGLDVHDAGAYQEPDGSPRVFKPGMVLSNEPGIYIREGTPGVEPKWFNIGVRLENDVLVTEGDPFDMTAGIPRRIADVEAEMARPPLTIETGKPAPPVKEGGGPAAEARRDAGYVEAGTVTPREQGKRKQPRDP